MCCPKCNQKLDLINDFEDDENKWEVYECKKCTLEVIKYIQ